MSAIVLLGIIEYGDVTHYRFSSGSPGSPPVTVRVGKQNVFACMTCYAKGHATDCEHADAARAIAAERADADALTLD